MKTIANVKNINPGKYYIILGANLEYNDQTYYEMGEKIFTNKFYSSIEEAKENLLDYIYQNFGWLELNMIESWYWDSSDIEENIFIKAFLEDNNINYIRDCELSISNLIDFVKIFGKSNQEILEILPSGYASIYEIELS